MPHKVKSRAPAGTGNAAEHRSQRQQNNFKPRQRGNLARHITNAQRDRALRRIHARLRMWRYLDSYFFKENPHRKFFIRRACSSELIEVAIRNQLRERPFGTDWYVLSHETAPGVFVRHVAKLPGLYRHEQFSEAACQAVFAQVTAAKREPGRE